MNEKEILEKAITKYGQNQLIVAIEELSELQKELTKYLRNKGNLNHIAEEIADVEIMVKQIKMYFCINDTVQEWKDYKIGRLDRQMKLEETGE